MQRVISRLKRRTIVSALVTVALHALFPAQAEANDTDKVLRVCQDPNNLPFSSRREPGFENRIAELLAADLGWKLEYTWFPQRMGFIRNTLRSFVRDAGRYKCDLVIGVPIGFELASVTKPYFTSTYALVFARGHGLDGIAKPEDLLKVDPQKLRSLKLGVVAQTPPVDWLLKHGLFDQAVSYQRQTGDPDQYPGEIVEKDLVAGKIDVAFVWGPIAGYFAKKVTTAKLVVVPFTPSPDIKFDYGIGMGVRFGERAWKEQVQQLIDRNATKIQTILAEYGVPLLDERGQLLEVATGTAGAAATHAGQESPYRVVDGKVDRATYLGWRLFHSTCFICHGTDATGSHLAPNLLPRVREMSARQFVGTVLHRYQLVVPRGELAGGAGARAVLIEQVLQRKEGEIPMPAWEGDPNVRPNVLDLYAYLRARADGVLGTGRPEPLPR